MYLGTWRRLSPSAMAALIRWMRTGVREALGRSFVKRRTVSCITMVVSAWCAFPTVFQQ